MAVNINQETAKSQLFQKRAPSKFGCVLKLLMIHNIEICLALYSFSLLKRKTTINWRTHKIHHIQSKIPNTKDRKIQSQNEKKTSKKLNLQRQKNRRKCEQQNETQRLEN
ncbi:Hypothetical_protein [Hexamita inflata]|uniref:Hypothetical_protein n=1 Tax=Hexamita inflata TaxID=28002 RepID=A0AA86QG49_9EUKA|nr:Hypothetical protein HINF_LOCUS45725 [Hexamita inflata]